MRRHDGYVATITCPDCGHAEIEQMPDSACLYFYECQGCRRLLRPRPGDCCVFCSYSEQHCPSAHPAGDRVH